MIKDIVIFNRYEHKRASLNVSLKMIMQKSFYDLGINVVFVSDYGVLKNIKNSICLFLIKPGNYISHLSYIDPSNLNFIWNLEPFSFATSGHKKFDGFREDFKKILNDKKYKIEHIFFFNKKQSDFFNNKNCSYLPIGFHSCLSHNNKKIEKTNNNILFLGQRTQYRDLFFRQLNIELKKRNLNFRVDCLTDDKFVDFETNKNNIYSYKIGLNHHAEDHRYHIHWHRIMIYGANNVLVLSQDLLDDCFKHMHHYVYYKNVKDLIDNLEYVIKNNQTQDISKNMNQLILNNYFLPSLIKNSVLYNYFV